MGDANAHIWTLCLSHGVRVGDNGRCPITGCAQSSTFEAPTGYVVAAEICLDFGVVGERRLCDREKLEVKLNLLAMRNA